MRKFLALLLAAAFCLTGLVFAHGAETLYSVSVAKNRVSFVRGGVVTGTFATLNNDITLMTSEGGDLLVCFLTSQSKNVGVTLGKQSIVTISGTVGAMQLDSSLDRPVVVGAGSTVQTLEHNAPVKLSVWGKVVDLSATGDAVVVAAKGSVIDKAVLYGSDARLYANEGSRVEDQYDSWDDSKDDDDDDDDDRGSKKLDLEYDSLYISSSGQRLSTYTSKLTNSVAAYNSDGKQVYGEAEWVTPSTKVRSTGWYEFRFKPYSSRYAVVRDEIQIIVGDDEEGDDTLEGDITLRISDLETSSKSKRLRNFTTELEKSVRAYNSNDKRITGSVRWVDSDDTRVSETEEFEFRFIPDDRKYGRVYGWITIYVD